MTKTWTTVNVNAWTEDPACELTQRWQCPEKPCRGSNEANLNQQLRGEEDQKGYAIEVGDLTEYHAGRILEKKKRRKEGELTRRFVFM